MVETAPPPADPWLPLLVLSALVSYVAVGLIGSFAAWRTELVAAVGAGPTLILWLLVRRAVRTSGLTAGLSLLALVAVLAVALIAFLHSQLTMAELGSAIQYFLCKITAVHRTC